MSVSTTHTHIYTIISQPTSHTFIKCHPLLSQFLLFLNVFLEFLIIIFNKNCVIVHIFCAKIMNFFMKKNDTKPSQKSSIQLSKNFPDIKKKLSKQQKNLYTRLFFSIIFFALNVYLCFHYSSSFFLYFNFKDFKIVNQK
jgi:c-di-AMP phosphodiesterase-like protein